MENFKKLWGIFDIFKTKEEKLWDIFKLFKEKEEGYSIDYFIRKFSKIPESKWGRGSLAVSNGATCVLGHCGLVEYQNPSDEVISLIKIFAEGREIYQLPASPDRKEYHYHYVYDYNDVRNNLTPKQNIINKLKELKKSK